MTEKRLIIYPSFYVFWAVFCLLDGECLMPVFVLAVLIHEGGHVLAISACGGRIEGVELSAFGAVLRQGRRLGYMADAAISLAGPAAGMAAAWVLSAAGYPMCAGANVLLSAVNCLPVLPLDGGCFVYACNCMTPVADVGTQIFARLSLAAALIWTACGVAFFIRTGGNATLFAIGLCLLNSNRVLLRNPLNCGMI